MDKSNNRRARIAIVICFVIVGLIFGAASVARAAGQDTLINEDLIYPQKMVVMDGVDYVMDQGQLTRVTEGKTEVLADIANLADLKKHNIKETDIPTFRPAHMAVHKGVIYVSGNIHRDYGNNDGTGAVYSMILAYKNGAFEVMNWQREQDAVAPIVTDWNDFRNPQVLTFGDTLLYDYLGTVHTRTAMGFVGDHMYFTYFGSDEVNMEGLAVEDLTTKKVKKLIEGNGFDYLSGKYTRMDYWQGYAPEYTVIPSADEKTITIIDGNRNIYQLDMVRHQFKHVAYFGSDVKFMTKARVRDGMIYYVNDRGLWKQSLSGLKTRPVQIFDPKKYNWGTGKIGQISDWDFLNDNTIDILDFTNHRIVRLPLDMGGDN